jgi:hypothetical protein
MMVIQDQNIFHEGLPTTQGIAYILRTDIIYEREACELIKRKDF